MVFAALPAGKAGCTEGADRYFAGQVRRSSAKNSVRPDSGGNEGRAGSRQEAVEGGSKEERVGTVGG